jgi:hypothetical protein
LKKLNAILHTHTHTHTHTQGVVAAGVDIDRVAPTRLKTPQCNNTHTITITQGVGWQGVITDRVARLAIENPNAHTHTHTQQPGRVKRWRDIDRVKGAWLD